MSCAVTYHPNAELVARAWLAQVTGITAGMVSTTLPADKTTWTTDGFITVQCVGGQPSIDYALRGSAIQVDCWANSGTSSRPPWGKAAQLAEKITAGIYARQGQQAVLTMPVTGYYQVFVREVIPTQEFRRVPGDDASYARYTADLIVKWTELVT